MSEEYIKRGDAIKASTPAFRNAFSDWEAGWIESKDDTKDMIENLPSEDVAPVRHGRWDADMGGVWCSVCGEYSEGEWDYCPYCGARMDGESDE